MKIRKLDFSVDKKEFRELKREVDWFLKILKREVRKKYDADIFLGGSFAKGTLTKSKSYDADIFVRFDWKYVDLSVLLEKVLKGLVKENGLTLKKMHGSRDYFKVYRNEKLTFEVIPVSRIKKVKEARNVTDLSYFHVRYVKRKLNDKMKKELATAKKFFKAQGVYGAESYIHGFSGYGLECLIIYYKNFEKMLKELVKVKSDERLVIDIEKFYKKKTDVFFELNESKLHSPVILIDPTWKERNVLASLSRETFEKFKARAKKYLKNPSENCFVEKGFDEREFRKKKGEFLHVVLETNRQEGDIAGTKMKKFSGLLEEMLKEYFDVIDKEFVYSGEGNKGNFYLVLKSKKEVFKLGPPIDRKKDVMSFKRANKKTVRKDGLILAKENVDFTAVEFLKKWCKSKEGKLKMQDMGIVSLKVLC